MSNKLENISLTGRLCYLFMCIEKYLTATHPDREWNIVAKRFWQWTGIYWDEGVHIYSQVVPEYLFEFDNYDETNLKSFEGDLSKEDYYTLINLFTGITDGNSQDEINQVLMLPIEFNNLCDGMYFKNADEPTLTLLYNLQQLLLSHDISLPDVDKISSMTIEEKNGFGNSIDSEYLSIIIKS